MSGCFTLRRDPRRTYDVLAFVETTTAVRPTETRRRVHSPELEMAPAPTNLELAGTGDVPEGWDWSESQRVHAHQVALSDERAPSGERSVRIARASAPWYWGEGRLEQTFSAEPWCGKPLRFSGAVRAEVEGPGAGAQIYIEVRPTAPEEAVWVMPAAAMVMIDRPVRLPHWSRYTVEIDVPETAYSIVIGLALAGNGAAWFSDLALTSG